MNINTPFKMSPFKCDQFWMGSALFYNFYANLNIEQLFYCMKSSICGKSQVWHSRCFCFRNVLHRSKPRPSFRCSSSPLQIQFRWSDMSFSSTTTGNAPEGTFLTSFRLRKVAVIFYSCCTELIKSLYRRYRWKHGWKTQRKTLSPGWVPWTKVSR